MTHFHRFAVRAAVILIIIAALYQILSAILRFIFFQILPTAQVL